MTTSANRKLVVYLAGGMHSGWQDSVIEKFSKRVRFLDPRAHKLKDPRLYVQRDLDFVRRSDIVFGFLEKRNPSGLGLAVELGFARALGKKIVLVNELRTRYARFCDEVSDHAEPNLKKGIARLEMLLNPVKAHQ